MGWLSGWEYRKKITIQGQSGAGSNYAVHLRIGSSSGGDFHLEGHCQNFPHDIRFTKGDGETELYYWIEDLNADPIDVWVKVPDSLDEDRDIYIYFGKSGETTTRDGDNTFDFFDDFLGEELNTDKWDDMLWGGGVVSDSILRIKAPEGDHSRVASHTWFEAPKQLVFKALLRDEDYRWDHGGFDWTIKDCSTSGDMPHTEPFVACYSKIDECGRCGVCANTPMFTTFCTYISNAWEHGVWRRYHIKWTTSKVKFWLTPSSQWYECTENVPFLAMAVKLGSVRESGAPDTWTEFDWVFVAPYHDPEPCFKSAGPTEHLVSISGICSGLSYLTGCLFGLVGLLFSSTNVTGTLIVSFRLVGVIGSNSFIAGNLLIPRYLSGTTPGLCTIDGFLKPLRRLLCTPHAQSSTISYLTLSYTLLASATPLSSLTADLFRTFSITGLSSGLTTTNAMSSITRTLISTLTPLSTIQGSLHQSYAISGSSTPSSHLTGFTLPVLFLSGSFNPTSTAQSSLTRTRSIVGLFTGSTSCCGLLSLIFLLRSFGKPFVPLSCRSFKWRDVR